MQRFASRMVDAPLDLTALLDDLEVIPYTADRAGRITWVSPTVVKLLGYRPAEIVGREPELFVPSDGLVRARDHLARKVDGTAERTIFELTALAKDGSRVPMQIIPAPQLEEGKIVGVRGVAVPRRETKPERPLLTPRQYEVVQLLAEGKTTAGIADQLEISEQTARNHIRAVLAALDCHSRLEAVAAARRAGII